MFPIPPVIRPRSGNQVCHRPYGKDQAGQGPCRQGPSDPLDDLAQVIRAADPAIQSTLGNTICRFTGIPQFKEYRVRLIIDTKAGYEKNKPDYESDVRKPIRRIPTRERKQIPAVQGAVHRVEKESETNDQNGDALFSIPQSPGIDKSSIDVVDFPQNEKHDWNRRK